MRLLIISLCLMVYQVLAAQVGIGTAVPNSSAVLELNSTTRGFRPPQVTSLERMNIIQPVAGLMVWCTDCGTQGEMQIFNGRSWTNMAGETPAGDTLAVGDECCGGEVVYLLQPGDKGYEEGFQHGLIIGFNGEWAWGCDGQTIGAISNDVGDGKEQTVLMREHCDSDGVADYIEAFVEFWQLSYDDWYLPSLDELSGIVANQLDFDTPIFLGNYLLTSTELDDNFCMTLNTLNGMARREFKQSSAKWLTIRSF